MHVVLELGRSWKDLKACDGKWIHCFKKTVDFKTMGFKGALAKSWSRTCYWKLTEKRSFL